MMHIVFIWVTQLLCKSNAAISYCTSRANGVELSTSPSITHHPLFIAASRSLLHCVSFLCSLTPHYYCNLHSDFEMTQTVNSQAQGFVHPYNNSFKMLFARIPTALPVSTLSVRNNLTLQCPRCSDFPSQFELCCCNYIFKPAQYEHPLT